MTGEQIRAARALLKWSAKRLAEEANVGWATIQRLESKNGPLAGYEQTHETLRQCLENAGIQFLENDDTALGYGVVLKEVQED